MGLLFNISITSTFQTSLPSLNIGHSIWFHSVLWYIFNWNMGN